jgi:aspartyl/glutamyl-tRNA(Asn/Gln) amidotransferase C subunit
MEFMLTPKDIDNLAALARLDIPVEEKEGLRKDVDSVLGYVSEIQKLSGGALKKEAGDVKNVFREDANPHLSGEFSEDLLAEAPRRKDNYIKVKKIL